MTGPAYHLRTNKAADRHLLIEAIRRLARLGGVDLGEYTYHGFGGPLLEDFRQLYEIYPNIPMISIEKNEQTFKRQEFHRPCSTSILDLRNESLSSYIDRYNPGNAKSIFWLDYTELVPDNFECFQRLLKMVAPDSMIKVTLPADPEEKFAPESEESPELISKFRKKFRAYMPPTPRDPPEDPEGFAFFVKQMLENTVQDALLAAAKGRNFIPVSSFRYSDGTPMLTLTGVVCEGSRENKLRETFADWKFADLTWGPPMLIDVPVLSTKERLRLQPLLPEMSAHELCDELGYMIGCDKDDTKKKMEQYASFHRQVPYFLRGVP